MPTHGFIKSSEQFPIQKCVIFCKLDDIKEFRGGEFVCTTQAILPTCSAFGVIAAEIAEKGPLRTELFSEPLPTASQRDLSKLFCSEYLIAGIPESRQYIADIVECIVNGGYVDIYIRVLLFNPSDTLRCGHQE